MLDIVMAETATVMAESAKTPSHGQFNPMCKISPCSPPLLASNPSRSRIFSMVVH